jgi:transposase
MFKVWTMTTESTRPNCRRLLAEWESLRAQLEEVRKRIAALEAEARRGRCSAVPFSRDEPKPDPKPPGRRPGRGRFRYRSRPPEKAIQETLEVPLEACPECGVPWRTGSSMSGYGLTSWRSGRSSRGSGRNWGANGRLPLLSSMLEAGAVTPSWAGVVGDGAAGVSLGPRARELAADRKHRLGIPYRKVAGLFRVALGLEVTASGLCQADERLAEKAEPVYQELVKAIRDSVAVHAAETGWRVGGRRPGCGFLPARRGPSTPSMGAGPMRWIHS